MAVNVITHIFTCSLLAFCKSLLNNMLILSVPQGERSFEIPPCGVNTGLGVVVSTALKLG